MAIDTANGLKQMLPGSHRKLSNLIAAVTLALTYSSAVGMERPNDGAKLPTISRRGSRVVVVPQVDNSFLLNPGKGYVQYYGAENEFTAAYTSVGYTRITWAKLEPEEGKFNWKEIDAFVHGFKSFGKRSAFGVMSVSTGIGAEYVTPKWVFDAGANPLEIPDSSTPSGKQTIPRHWNDPIFLKKLANFVKALAERYDGDPDIAFVDIRDYGNWGEGHTGMLGSDPDVQLAPPELLRDGYLKPYFDAFSHTRLIVPWGHPSYDAVYDWAVTKGAGIRRDGILSRWSKDGSECARTFGHSPAVFEYCDSYADTKKNGYWSQDLLIKYIRAGKASYIQWDPNIFKENREFSLYIGNLVGYHFVVKQVEFPAVIKPDRTFAIQLTSLNDGVAPIYQDCFVKLALLSKDDRVVADAWVDAVKPAKWMPSAVIKENGTVTFHGLKAGVYRIAIGLFDSKKARLPIYRLGITGRTDDGWYDLGPIVAARR